MLGLLERGDQRAELGGGPGDSQDLPGGRAVSPVEAEWLSSLSCGGQSAGRRRSSALGAGGSGQRVWTGHGAPGSQVPKPNPTCPAGHDREVLMSDLRGALEGEGELRKGDRQTPAAQVGGGCRLGGWEEREGARTGRDD